MLHGNKMFNKPITLISYWYNNEWAYSNKVVDLINYVDSVKPATV